MTEPLVVIIVVNWNGKSVTHDCLESLRMATYPNFRVVVVDNGSSDGSVEAIRTSHPEVVLLEQKQNRRFAGGNNAGIRYAVEHDAELLCLLNNDTTVDKDFLSHLVVRIRSNATCGAVAPKIYYYDNPDRIWFAGGEISMWTGTLKHTGIREKDCGQHDETRIIDYATGCCFLTTREVVAKVGAFDETFFMYTEDADWSLRARRAGYAICFEPKSKIWHKVSVASGGHLSLFKMKNKFISNFRFFCRYASVPQRLVFPWMNLVVNGWAAAKYFITTRR